MKLIIDTHYLMRRSMHSKANMTIQVGWMDRPLITGSGRVAINTIISLVKYIHCFYPSLELKDIMFADEGGPTFRHEMYPRYKKNRVEQEYTKEESHAIMDMFVMKNVVISFFHAMGSKVFKKKGFEADDVIGYIAKYRSDRELSTMIFTNDHDISQMVTNHTSLIRPDSRGFETITPVTLPYMVKLKIKSDGDTEHYWNCLCRCDVILYKALVGDTSDNYPGVKGFGGRAWKELKGVLHFHSIKSSAMLSRPEETISRIRSLEPAVDKYMNMIESQLENFKLFAQLAMIRRNAKPDRYFPWYRDVDTDDPFPKRINPKFNTPQDGYSALGAYQMRNTLENVRSVFG